jgi:hypothetical protein
MLGIEESTGVLSSSNLLPSDAAHATAASVVSSTDYEGELIHYFTEKLGRWLDCGHPILHFTLGIPEKLRSCSVLHGAVLLFAARHKRDRSGNAYTDQLHPHIYTLDQTMSEKDAETDDFLCTLLISHFIEQINGNDTPTVHRLQLIITQLRTRKPWIFFIEHHMLSINTWDYQ